MADPPKPKGRKPNRADVRTSSLPNDTERATEGHFVGDTVASAFPVRPSKLRSSGSVSDEDFTNFLAPPPGLRNDERQRFNKIISAISSTMNPDGFLEQYQCREIASQIWRLEQLRYVRETFINDRTDLALAFILIGRTDDDVVALMTRMREGDPDAQKQMMDLKSQFDISDADVRAHVELRYHGDLGRIDQHIRSVEHVRDRTIDDFEKRRFMRLANKRLASQASKLVER